MLKLVSSSADETRRIGGALAAAVPRPAVVLLRGDYGTGKTTLVQGLAAGLGVRGAVRSPSYNIVRLYRGERGSLVHVDLYRAHGPAEIDELGIWEFVESNTVVAVEWPGDLAPADNDYSPITIDFELGPSGEPGAEPPRLLRLDAAAAELAACAGALSAFTTR